MIRNHPDAKHTHTMNAEYLNTITRELTCFASFAALLNAAGNYRPSIYLAKGDYAANRAKIDLALAYDDAQEARGDERRAFRGNWAS